MILFKTASRYLYILNNSYIRIKFSNLEHGCYQSRATGTSGIMTSCAHSLTKTSSSSSTVLFWPHLSLLLPLASHVLLILIQKMLSNSGSWKYYSLELQFQPYWNFLVSINFLMALRSLLRLCLMPLLITKNLT